MNELEKVSDVMKKLAGLGWEYKIKGKTLERNSLLQPINMIFDQLRKQNQIIDLETVRSATSQKIFDYIERIADASYKPGDTKANKITEFVDVFFKGLLEKFYHNKISTLLSDEKNLKASYLFYLRNSISPSKEKGEN